MFVPLAVCAVCLSLPPCAHVLLGGEGGWGALASVGTTAGEDGLNLHHLWLEQRLLVLDQPFKKLCVSLSFGKPFLSLPQLGGQIFPFCNSTKANLASVFPYFSAKDPIKRGPDKSLQRELFPLQMLSMG